MLDLYLIVYQIIVDIISPLKDKASNRGREEAKTGRATRQNGTEARCKGQRGGEGGPSKRTDQTKSWQGKRVLILPRRRCLESIR